MSGIIAVYGLVVSVLIAGARAYLCPYVFSVSYIVPSKLNQEIIRYLRDSSILVQDWPVDPRVWQQVTLLELLAIL